TQYRKQRPKQTRRERREDDTHTHTRTHTNNLVLYKEDESGNGVKFFIGTYYREYGFLYFIFVCGWGCIYTLLRLVVVLGCGTFVLFFSFVLFFFVCF